MDKTSDPSPGPNEVPDVPPEPDVAPDVEGFEG